MPDGDRLIARVRSQIGHVRSRSLDVHFVRTVPVCSPLGVGAPHAAPLRLRAGI